MIIGKYIREDLNRLPIEGIDGSNTKEIIVELLQKFGISKKNGIVTVEIWGSGKPMRELLWVEDMAEASVFLLKNYDFGENNTEITEVRNTHINIGTGNDVSIATLADIIKTVVGFQGDFTFNTSKPDGTMKKLYDANKSKINALGWKANVSLKEGLKKCTNGTLNNV